MRGKQIEHVGVELHAKDDHERRRDGDERREEHNQPPTVRDEMGDGAIQTHACAAGALAAEDEIEMIFRIARHDSKTIRLPLRKRLEQTHPPAKWLRRTIRRSLP